MATLNGGRGELNDAASASIHRIDRQIGHLLQITEARRPMWLQEKYWDEYQDYLNGGPWAPIAAYPSEDAPHIRNGGEAIDTDERITDVLNEHGWFHTVYRGGELVEPWHYEYFADRDQHRNAPATPESEEDIVKGILFQIDPAVDGRWVVVDTNAGTYYKVDNGTQLDWLRALGTVVELHGAQPPAVIAGYVERE